MNLIHYYRLYEFNIIWYVTYNFMYLIVLLDNFVFTIYTYANTKNTRHTQLFNARYTTLSTPSHHVEYNAWCIARWSITRLYDLLLDVFTWLTDNEQGLCYSTDYTSKLETWLPAVIFMCAMGRLSELERRERERERERRRRQREEREREIIMSFQIRRRFEDTKELLET